MLSGLAVFAGAFAGAQETQEPAQILFVAEDDQGTVWVNVGLAVQDQSGAYLPLVVGVQNKAASEIKLNRESFLLIDLDDVVYTMPTVKEWRKSYKRMVIDRRLMSTSGIPWEVWWSGGRLARSNFFPDLRSTRGNTTVDSITLRTGYGMVDLLYFEQLRTSGDGRPFLLSIRPEGWEVPIQIRLLLP
jgi:hypothetical protein